MPRLFVAMDLPEPVVAELSLFCCGLPGARWVAPEQLHLTLRFVGEVDGGLFREIREALQTVDGGAFDLRVKGFGCFPPRKPPRVLWAGVEPGDEVIALRNRIERALVRLGIEPETRKFSPHITLARPDGTPIGKVTQFLAGNSLYASPTFTVSEFHLYSSVLTPKGAIHTMEASYPLTMAAL
ncbi:MAG: RNA 2',3'-cyclic phosphodiesterase [Thermodesulfobacteriota bacterium]